MGRESLQGGIGTPGPADASVWTPLSVMRPARRWARSASSTGCHNAAHHEGLPSRAVLVVPEHMRDLGRNPSTAKQGMEHPCGAQAMIKRAPEQHSELVTPPTRTD